MFLYVYTAHLQPTYLKIIFCYWVVAMRNSNPANQIYRGLETCSENIYEIESEDSHIFDRGLLEDVTDIAVYTAANALKQFDNDDRKILLDKFDVDDVEEMRRTVGFADDKPVASLEAFLDHDFDDAKINNITDRKDLQLGNFKEGTAEILVANKNVNQPLEQKRKTAFYEPLKYTADLSYERDEKDTKPRKPREKTDAVSSTWVI